MPFRHARRRRAPATSALRDAIVVLAVLAIGATVRITVAVGPVPPALATVASPTRTVTEPAAPQSAGLRAAEREFRSEERSAPPPAADPGERDRDVCGPAPATSGVHVGVDRAPRLPGPTVSCL